MPSSAICTAVSSTVAVPVPLSLMPGPSWTESRCAPTTTVRSSRPVGVSAITLNVSVVSVVASTITRASTAPAPTSASPIAKLVPIAGIAASGGSRVPKTTPNRSSPGTSLPWLKTTIALAPFAAALSTFTRNVHVPRCTSAILPGVNESKSLSSQPLVDARSPARLTSTAWSVAVMSPDPE